MKKHYNHDESIITGMDIQNHMARAPVNKITVSSKKKKVGGRKKKR